MIGNAARFRSTNTECPMKALFADTRRFLALCILALWIAPAHAQDYPPTDALPIHFDGKRGQVEVGGAFAGVEFHDSRPVPARFSFYSPVANSIDLSTDYWQRGTSRPLAVSIRAEGRTDHLGAEPWAYRWTPFGVTFHSATPAYDATLAYQFAEDLPIVVLTVTVRNRTAHETLFGVDIQLQTRLRTSHAYVWRDPAQTRYTDDGTSFVARFDAADTDSAAVFVANAGAMPAARMPDSAPGKPEAAFSYEQRLAPGDSLVVVQLIGTSRQRDAETVRRRATATWRENVRAYEKRIREYVRHQGHFDGTDTTLHQTYRLAKALLQADKHYLDGRIVPMPSPAEYNFFFTHDLLVTDLGAVFFDVDRVRDDLRYVHSLVQPDSVLPHAYYWREDGFKTEFANADNWNHLWFVLLTASYLKHSADTATVAALYPVVQKSIALMLKNERNGLMWAERPDWWDIGHVPGPRAYLTVLTIRALRAYAYLTLQLGEDATPLSDHLAQADAMQRALVETLWDDDAGYLLNGLDSATVDRHYYTGSLLATAYGLLDPDHSATLLETARRELVDPQVGVRNAMPADFHTLVDVYRFQEGEVGAPYLYMNGGVWPQGNAWYALALLAAERPDEARAVLDAFLSVGGITRSPYGQPAFYEYRDANPASPTYGAIDKPTFLWAGGWFLHVLYHLGGVRETPWNLSFSPHLPTGFDNVAYSLEVGGRLSEVTWSGSGRTFRRIVVDGTEVPSAVLVGAPSRIALERGAPTGPYLAAASCIVEDVERTDEKRALVATVRGVVGQQVELEIVSPAPLHSAWVDGHPLPATALTTTHDGGVYTVRVQWKLDASGAKVKIGP